MSPAVQAVVALLEKCSEEERREVLLHLRQALVIHPIEQRWNVSAEIILAAIDRSSDLTQRGVRGVIAEACFEAEIIRKLLGWRQEAVVGDLPYDFLIADSVGSVRIQVKMQRSEKGSPKVSRKFSNMFVVETQRTRSGKDDEGNSTRPYRYGEFDILAVSLQPSTKTWDTYMYTVANWLLPKEGSSSLLATLQPVSAKPDDAWTDDLIQCVSWLRSGERRHVWKPPPGATALFD